MGRLETARKHKCPKCGNGGIEYQLSQSQCFHCGYPIEFDTYCTCNSTSVVDCKSCPDNQNKEIKNEYV